MTSAIKNISSTTTFFENKITWERTQPVDSYKILKEYVEFDSWVEEPEFTAYYAISTNSLHLLGSFVTFIDTDLSFNEIYRYVITPVSSVNTYASENVVIYTQSGNVSDLKHTYSQNDASFNITWSLLTDISSNTELTWDISWTEISGNPIQSHSVTFPKIDSSVNDINSRQRKVYLHDRPYLYADASYNYQIKATYINQSPTLSWSRASQIIQSTLYSTIYIDSSGSSYGPQGNFYNYKKPPVLNTVSTGDNLDISWTSSSTSTETPSYYDISLSHVTIPDISYNIRVTDGLTLTDPSRNVQNYYPGNYNIRVKSGYGYSVPTVSSLFSEWSADSSFNIPYHAATNFEALSTNSEVKLAWKNPIDSVYMIPSYPIPKSYVINRRTVNKEKNYELDFSKNDISRTDTSFNDTTYPIGTQVPRIYVYDLSANYD